MNVQAETLYEAVALAVRAFREHGCAPGPASRMEVEAKTPSVTHTVSMARVRDWLESSAKSPSDKVMKDRLKGLLFCLSLQALMIPSVLGMVCAASA